MSMTVPRDLVAEVLGISPEALPDDDLPVSRLAARLLAFLQLAYDAEDPNTLEDAWTFTIFGNLVQNHPEIALQTLLSGLAQIDTEEDAELLATGPLDELVNAKTAEALLPRLEAAAKASPRFVWALSAVNPEGSAGTPFWKALRALTDDGPSAVDGDPLPEA